jgi:hypothetical protein
MSRSRPTADLEPPSRSAPKRAVAIEADDLYVGLGGLGTDPKRHPHTHRANGPGIKPLAGNRVGID